MGITNFSIWLLEKALKINPNIKTVGEYGAQILYTPEHPNMPFANIWYEEKGISYTCFDLAGDNYAHTVDLSYPVVGQQFDLVTDFGQSEHIVQAESYTTAAFEGGKIHSVYPEKITNKELGYYYAWKNKHDLLKIGGLMINENPRSGHWPGHGYHYLFPEFCYELCGIADYELIDVGEHCAMGNCETGKNVYSILKKTGTAFPTFEQFKTLSFTNQ